MYNVITLHIPFYASSASSSLDWASSALTHGFILFHTNSSRVLAASQSFVLYLMGSHEESSSYRIIIVCSMFLYNNIDFHFLGKFYFGVYLEIFLLSAIFILLYLIVIRASGDDNRN